MQAGLAAETKNASGSARFYRPELDLLRFIAFLLVYSSHVLPQRDNGPHYWAAAKEAGALGVPVFFMLSAYLITELLFREKTKTSTVDLKAFYIRRMLRIWPLYFFAILVGFVLSHVLPSAPVMSTGALLSYLFLVGNWYTVFHGFLPLGIGTLWSICLEEQFYLLWPSLAKFGKRSTMWAVSIAIWIICQVGLLWMCVHRIQLSPAIWTNSFTHFQYFAMGAMISLVLKGKVPRIPTALRALMIFAGLGILFVANYFFDAATWLDFATIRLTYFGYLVTGFGVLLLILGVMGANVPKSLSPGVWLGKISYGLYVYHVPLILLLNAMLLRFAPKMHHGSIVVIGLGFPLTVFISYLSYRFFETPFLKIKERFSIVHSRAV